MQDKNSELPATTQSNVAVQQPPSLQGLLTQDSVKKRFEEMLGKKSAGFISSIISATKANKTLADCEPNSILSAAVIAATLDLPIQNNLGFAAIVPYNESYKELVWDEKQSKQVEVWKKRSVAQFQMQWKGFVQLGNRTGQYKTMNASEVFKGELVSENRFTGEYEFDPSKKESDEIIGYMAYFKLTNGFEKTIYWPVAKIHAHAKRYSKSYENAKGQWKLDFDSMAKKTVLKNLLSKFGPLSVDTQMQQAINYDQAVVNDDGEIQQAVYVDNDELPEPIILEELIALLEETQSKLSKPDHENAWRIVNNKEENSYSKLQKELLKLK